MQKRFVFLSVFLLVFAVLLLTSIGIVMLTSTGAYARDAKGDPSYFLKRQLLWLAVGVVCCVVAAVMDYRWMEKRWWMLYALAGVLLVCCFIPGIGKKINGSRRWIGLAGQTFQPSEMAKLAVLVGLAWWYSRKETLVKTFRSGFLYPLLGVAALIALIASEVDLGTSALIFGTAVVVMFVAGTRLRYLAAVTGLGLAGLYCAVQLMPERLGRLLAFFYPDKYPDDAYQQVQGLIAFGSGGISGLGLGNGRQKNSWLPYAHTDFILPSLGEELGLAATLAVVLLFLLILVSGTIIATRASDRFGKLLGFGVVSLIGFQAALNIGVTTMVLPNKGLPLPFISYGGSNLAFCLIGIGILISIYRRGFGERPDPEGRVFAAKVRRRKTPRI